MDRRLQRDNLEYKISICSTLRSPPVLQFERFPRSRLIRRTTYGLIGHLPLFVKKRQTCFFWVFDSSSVLAILPVSILEGSPNFAVCTVQSQGWNVPCQCAAICVLIRCFTEVAYTEQKQTLEYFKIYYVTACLSSTVDGAYTQTQRPVSTSTSSHKCRLIRRHHGTPQW